LEQFKARGRLGEAPLPGRSTSPRRPGRFKTAAPRGIPWFVFPAFTGGKNVA